MIRLIYGCSGDPWHNLAAEEAYFEDAGDDVLLYLWQNDPTVVIGRNQNAWKECRVHLLEGEGGRLARRQSGGGAVYHDGGNLNFTFITARESYDDARETGVILAAVKSLGIDARFTGRNDLVTASGAKFSGNAYRFTRARAMRHGTLLVCSDMERLTRYLAPPREKYAAKGVESVRSRVCNLGEFGPHINIGSVKQAMADAFSAEYGAPRIESDADLPPARIAAAYARHASWQWRMGATPAFDASFETRFPWGGVELLFTLERGVIKNASACSDAMDAELIPAVAAALCGAPLRGDAVRAALGGFSQEEARDIALWLGRELP